MNITNPFTFEAANNLSIKEIEGLYIDIERSEFLTSQKNIFIEGHRGSGKSMLLRYNSIDMKHRRDMKLDFIGVYVSCQTPLFSKEEHETMDEAFEVNVTAEHMFTLMMAESLVLSILTNKILSDSEECIFIDEIRFYFDLDESISSVKRFHSFIKKEIKNIQGKFLDAPEVFYKKAYTYSSLILPIIDSLKSTTELGGSHFSFFMDDAQNLDKYQKKFLNSWVSFRDTSNISFKIAITSQKEYLFYTNSNTAILEDHDYMMINLEKDFFGNESGFYQFAKKVIEKRLVEFNIGTINVDDFFPQSEEFVKNIEEIGKKFINGEYEEQKDKTVSQRKKSVSKYRRAIYFREKLSTPKANLPSIAYTGFGALANISTGIIRNLLIPISKMYDKELEKGSVKFIPATTQYSTMKEVSKNKWEYLESLDNKITGCDEATAKNIYNFLMNFGKKLRKILLDVNSSEKRILTFTIEQLDNSNKQDKDKILAVLNIAHQSGLLYSRIGPGKNTNRTIWYTPNRILWVDLGLDPEGQNGRINITPTNFYKMISSDNIKEVNENQMEIPI